MCLDGSYFYLFADLLLVDDFTLFLRDHMTSIYVVANNNTVFKISAFDFVDKVCFCIFWWGFNLVFFYTCCFNLSVPFADV